MLRLDPEVDRARPRRPGASAARSFAAYASRAGDAGAMRRRSSTRSTAPAGSPGIGPRPPRAPPRSRAPRAPRARACSAPCRAPRPARAPCPAGRPRVTGRAGRAPVRADVGHRHPAPDLPPSPRDNYRRGALPRIAGGVVEVLRPVLGLLEAMGEGAVLVRAVIVGRLGSAARREREEARGASSGGGACVGASGSWAGRAARIVERSRGRGPSAAWTSRSRRRGRTPGDARGRVPCGGPGGSVCTVDARKASGRGPHPRQAGPDRARRD